jgi:hypothetical protein
MSMFEEAIREAKDIIECQRWDAPDPGEGGMTVDMAVEIERSLLKARDLLEKVIRMAETSGRQAKETS